MSAPTKPKFSEFVDLLLARLYEADQTRGGSGEYFDLHQMAAQFSDKPTFQWVFDAAKVLEARRLARCLFTFGAVHAQLTGEGRLYVEEEKGTGIIKQYHEKPSNFVVISGDGNQVVVGGKQERISQHLDVERERQPVFDLLGKIESIIKRDESLAADLRNDLLTDIDTIRNQLKKREPNRIVLAALLDPISQIATVGGFVANLIQMINS